MFLGLDSATACAQVSVPIPYPTGSSVENHPGLVSDGEVGIGGSGCAFCSRMFAQCQESLVKCTYDLVCISHGVVSNSATTY